MDKEKNIINYFFVFLLIIVTIIIYLLWPRASWETRAQGGGSWGGYKPTEVIGSNDPDIPDGYSESVFNQYAGCQSVPETDGTSTKIDCDSNEYEIIDIDTEVSGAVRASFYRFENTSMGNKNGIVISMSAEVIDYDGNDDWFQEYSIYSNDMNESFVCGYNFISSGYSDEVTDNIINNTFENCTDPYQENITLSDWLIANDSEEDFVLRVLTRFSSSDPPYNSVLLNLSAPNLEIEGIINDPGVYITDLNVDDEHSEFTLELSGDTKEVHDVCYIDIMHDNTTSGFNIEIDITTLYLNKESNVSTSSTFQGFTPELYNQGLFEAYDWYVDENLSDHTWKAVDIKMPYRTGIMKFGHHTKCYDTDECNEYSEYDPQKTFCILNLIPVIDFSGEIDFESDDYDIYLDEVPDSPIEWLWYQIRKIIEYLIVPTKISSDKLITAWNSFTSKAPYAYVLPIMDLFPIDASESEAPEINLPMPSGMSESTPSYNLDDGVVKSMTTVIRGFVSIAIIGIFIAYLINVLRRIEQ